HASDRRGGGPRRLRTLELLHAVAVDARCESACRRGDDRPRRGRLRDRSAGQDNQFVHKGDILLVLDQERYKLALAKAEATVAARKAEMLMHQSQADRRTKLTDLAISTEAREDAQRIAASATAAYQQAVTERSTAGLNLERTVIRAPVNGFVTNLTLVV